MRLVVGVSAFLIVVAFVATFAVGSIVAVINAVTVLERPVTGWDDMMFDEHLDECDPFDVASCF